MERKKPNQARSRKGGPPICETTNTVLCLVKNLKKESPRRLYIYDSILLDKLSF